MGQLVELCGKGDLKLSWDRNNEKEIEAAEEIFNKRIKQGWSAFREKVIGCKGDKIKIFDPDAGRIILVMPVAGG